MKAEKLEGGGYICRGATISLESGKKIACRGTARVTLPNDLGTLVIEPDGDRLTVVLANEEESHGH